MDTKPKHTQDEWKLTTDGEANFFGIATNKKWLFRIQQNGELSSEQQQANAERIMKCVNMHDELIETLQPFLKLAITAHANPNYNKHQTVYGMDKAMITMQDLQKVIDVIKKTNL